MTDSPSEPRRDAGRPRGAPIARRILECALAELSEHGAEALSVERIARAAEVNKTSVYRRWPTREALVVAAIEHSTKGVTAALIDTGSLEGDLRSLVAQVASLVESPVGLAMLRAGMSDGREDSASLEARERLQQQVGAPIRAMVKRAQARGEWRDGVRGELLAFTLVGAVLHRVLLERAPCSARWQGALVELCLLGAVRREPPARAKRAAR